MTGKRGHVAFEIQWSARAAPIDPSSQAVPDSQFVMSSVPIKLNRTFNLKLIRRDLKREHFFPPRAKIARTGFEPAPLARTEI